MSDHTVHQFNAIGVCVHCLAEEGNLWACSGEKPRPDPAAPQAHDLAPSEVALAKMLAAYLEWYAAEKARYTGDDESVDHMGGALEDEYLLDYPKSAASDKGRALLDRARKAGVL